MFSWARFLPPHFFFAGEVLHVLKAVYFSGLNAQPASRLTSALNYSQLVLENSEVIPRFFPFVMVFELSRTVYCFQQVWFSRICSNDKCRVKVLIKVVRKVSKNLNLPLKTLEFLMVFPHRKRCDIFACFTLPSIVVCLFFLRPWATFFIDKTAHSYSLPIPFW